MDVAGYIRSVPIDQIGGVGRNTAVPCAAGICFETFDALAGLVNKLLCLFGGNVLFHRFSCFMAPIASCAGY